MNHKPQSVREQAMRWLRLSLYVQRKRNKARKAKWLDHKATQARPQGGVLKC